MTPLRSRLIQEAIDLTITDGWSEVTMERVAQRAGVSRQTVYNEVGNKADLARAMVQHELRAFLGLVDAAFDQFGPSEDGLRSAARAVLAFGVNHPLLGVIVAGGAQDLLPLLTTDAAEIRHAATHHVLARYPAFGAAYSDVIVRLILSYLTQPDPLASAHLDAVLSALADHQASRTQP